MTNAANLRIFLTEYSSQRQRCNFFAEPLLCMCRNGDVHFKVNIFIHPVKQQSAEVLQFPVNRKERYSSGRHYVTATGLKPTTS